MDGVMLHTVAEVTFCVPIDTSSRYKVTMPVNVAPSVPVIGVVLSVGLPLIVAHVDVIASAVADVEFVLTVHVPFCAVA